MENHESRGYLDISETQNWDNKSVDSHVPCPLKNKSSGKVDIEAVVKPFIVESPALKKALYCEDFYMNIATKWWPYSSKLHYEEVSMCWNLTKLTLTYCVMSQRSQKVQDHTHLKFWPQKHLREVWKQLECFLRSYCVHKVSWPWPSLQSHRMIKTELVQDFGFRNTYVKLESDCDIYWGVIVFTT